MEWGTCHTHMHTHTGLDKFQGINPSTGVVIYYNLPQIKDSAAKISIEIKDAEGNPVRTYSSKADSTYQKYNGGPPEEPVLSLKKGLNRFVWDMRYATIAGVPEIDFENSYRGHKASPGKYTVTLKMGNQTHSADAEILANPLYATNAAIYREYHTVMNSMETELTTMYRMVNSMNAKREQLASLIASLPADGKYNGLRTDGQVLVKKMKAWDDDMVQRKSKAYDDAENFPNKFTGNYMFLINQTESDIPRVNQPSLDLMKELNAEWGVLKNRGNEILNTSLPAMNKLLWEAGVGAIWK